MEIRSPAQRGEEEERGAKGAPDGKPRGGFMVPLLLCAREILSAAGRVPVAPLHPPLLCLSLLFTIRLFVSTRP